MQKSNELSIPSGNQPHSRCHSDLQGKQRCNFACGGSWANAGPGCHWQECPACCCRVCLLPQHWQPDISTWAAMKSVGLAGLIFGTGTRGVMADVRVVGASWGFWELWAPWKWSELQRSWKLGSLGVGGTAGVVEWAAEGLRTEITKEIPREKRLSL